MGRPSENRKYLTFRIRRELIRDAEEVREDGQTFTDQIEDGLSRHIKARKREMKRQEQA